MVTHHVQDGPGDRPGRRPAGDEVVGLVMHSISNEPHAVPRWYPMTVVAQDPSVRARCADGVERILTAQVRVPADWLEPGPRSHRFHVVDYDVTGDRYAAPASPVPGVGGKRAPARWRFDDPFPEPDEATIRDCAAFHAQNVFAVAARTLAHFEAALGRRVPWGFDGHQLFLVPHAFAEANAYYADLQRALLFGSFDGADGRPVHTCLSHDVVAHETTHAVLDGLRPRFEEPGLPDQNAFHEAFADIVALLSVFSVASVVERLLGEAGADGTIASATVRPEALGALSLFRLAEELGDDARPGQGGGLRRSLEVPEGGGWRRDPAYREPHRRGEVLVAVFMRTLLEMWSGRLNAIVLAERCNRAIVAEEGVKSALHLLAMAIRAIDYLPPLEIEFEDFLDAILVSDQEAAPDDERNYRGALRDAFARFDIHQPAGRMIDLRERTPTYRHVNFDALRSDRDEVFRFLWENAELFEFCREFHLVVDRVRPAARVGPDGFIVRETVATYVQTLSGTGAALRDLSREGGGRRGSSKALFAVPPRLRDTELQIFGGGAVVFDQFGRVKFHKTKPLLDWERQSRRLEYLAQEGLSDSDGRFGFSTGAGRGERFAGLHRRTVRSGEGW